jgi:hypothetical protein
MGGGGRTSGTNEKGGGEVDIPVHVGWGRAGGDSVFHVMRGYLLFQLLQTPPLLQSGL